MKRILFFSVVILSACSGDEKMPAPEKLIPSEIMIPLIVDLQILESHYQRTYTRPDLYKDALDSSSNLIFQNYDVTKADFDASFSYYSSDLDTIYSIYEAALDSINFRVNQKTF